DIDAARIECVALSETRERNARGAAVVDAVRYELRFAIRALASRPAFAAAVIVTLGVGFGANAAVFSVVDRLLFRPAPMLRDVSRTNRVYARYPDYDLKGSFVPETMPYLWYAGVADSNTSFERTAAYAIERMTIGPLEDRRDLQVAGVTPSFFQ